MSRQHHDLKIETQYYQDIEKGIKTFEVRKNDRDYKTYDMLYFKEVVEGVYTGRELQGIEVVYILKGGQYGIEKDYCIMGLNVNDIKLATEDAE